MKKILSQISLIVLMLFCMLSAQAKEACEANVCNINEMVQTEQNLIETKDKQSIEKFVANLEKKQNSHSLSAIKLLYTDDFMNTDGYNKEQLFDLMQRTFGSYPNIKTVFKIENIVTSNNCAMVLTKQNVTATTKEISKITGDKGEYSAVLYDILYLKKINEDWKIYSENVISETSKLAYGKAKNINARINAPQKVFSNMDYAAGVSIDVPVGFSAIASINNTQIVKGYNLSGEAFRQVPPDDTNLERILKANNSANNEAVVVSIGFTETSQDIFKKPKVDISGLMMLMQRVDVIPVNENNKKDDVCAKK